MSQRRDRPAVDAEYVPADDTVIGRAFRRSLAAFALIAAVVVGALLLRPRPAGDAPVLAKDPGAIAGLQVDAAALPELPFTDITEQAGIGFVHFDGARGEKLLPETMGGGAAFFDCDGDGDQDLLFVNGSAWSHDGGGGPGHALYRNDGRGRFEDISAGAGLAASGYGMGVAVGDYDGDGLADLFLTALGPDRLYRNLGGGRFADATAEAGVAGGDAQWSTSAGFFDADGDGDLDLFVCRYVRWTRAIDLGLAYTLNGVDRSYGPPTGYEGAFSALYRNDGGGRFTDVSAAAGIEVVNPLTGVAAGKALGVAFADFDLDGRTDVVVANDTVQNHLFHNLGECRFEEIGLESGIGFDGHGRATGAMGIDIADFRGDGSLGVGIGNFANEMSSLYVAAPGALRFSDDAMAEGIGSPSRQRLSFGLFWFDADLDGRLDLLQVNGHLEQTIHEVQPSQEYRQPAQLFWNAGPERPSCFVEMPADRTGALATKIAGRGSAYADIDGDGDLDLLQVQVGDRPLLLRNDQQLDHRWLRLRLRDRAPNVHALGARVELRTGGHVLRRAVTATRGYLSQSELPLTFGLGPDGEVDAIEVTWPDGTVQAIPVPDPLDREVEVVRAD